MTPEAARVLLAGMGLELVGGIELLPEPVVEAPPSEQPARPVMTPTYPQTHRHDASGVCQWPPVQELRFSEQYARSGTGPP